MKTTNITQVTTTTPIKIMQLIKFTFSLIVEFLVLTSSFLREDVDLEDFPP